MKNKKIIGRILLYSILALAAGLTVFSFSWYRWQGYKYHFQNRGIEVYSDCDSSTTKTVLDLCVSFREYFHQYILPVRSDLGGLKLYYFNDQRDYYNYCRRVRAVNTPHGFYSRRHRLIVINGPLGGYGTIFHEMVHFLLHRGGYRFPLWLEEGLAAFHERAMGYRTGGHDFLMLFGYLNPVKFKDLQAESYTRQMTFADMENQHTASTFFVFADRRRVLRKFLEAYLATQDLEASCRQAFGGGTVEVQQQWTDWLRNQFLGLDFEFWMRAQFFDSQESFENFINYYGARWDQDNEVFTTNR